MKFWWYNVAYVPGSYCNNCTCHVYATQELWIWYFHIPLSLVFSPWWRHQLERFSALLALCAGNSPVPGEFPLQRPVTRSFDVFFDLRLNKRLSKQSWSWWFEMLSRLLWRHRNATDSRWDTRYIVGLRSYGGNISTNPWFFMPAPRPVFIYIRKICRHHGSNCLLAPIYLPKAHSMINLIIMLHTLK